VRHVLPELAAGSAEFEGVILATKEGAEVLKLCQAEVLTVPAMSNSTWEQVGLPWYCRHIGAKAVYRHGSCGSMWGPPMLLHFTDDPRAAVALGATRTSPRERVRRAYQYATVGRGLRRARVVATYTKAIADGLRDAVGEGLSVVVVPLGVDTATFYPDGEGSVWDTVFHLSSPEPRDETIDLIKAYALALRAAPDLPDLVIAGDLGNQAKAVKNTVSDLGLRSRVQMLGRIPDAALREEYARAALCVQPSRYEGFGLQPLEALACGAPLIVSSEPAVQEVVGEAAMVVADLEPGTLAAAIVDAWSDTERRGILRRLGPQRAQHFSWSNTVDQIRALLDAMVTESRERAAVTSEH
jgi:glycosyltransferase involved in cell wall biosynthesis